MSKLIFTENAWDDYLYWQTQDRKTLRRVNLLLRDIQRDSFSGIGKPEPLKNDLTGLWSRRIDECNRIVYRVYENMVEVVQCRNHYDC